MQQGRRMSVQHRRRISGGAGGAGDAGSPLCLASFSIISAPSLHAWWYYGKETC